MWRDVASLDQWVITGFSKWLCSVRRYGDINSFFLLAGFKTVEDMGSAFSTFTNLRTGRKIRGFEHEMLQ